MRWSSCRRSAVAGVLEDAEAAGVKTATIYSAAMGDGPDPESHKRGAWLKDFLGRSKIKVAGPELHGRLQLSREDVRLSQQRAVPLPGRLGGAAFQSGGTLQFWLRTAADRGLRFSYGITSGNEISFDLADYLNFLVDDPEHQRDRAVHRGHPPAATPSWRRPGARSKPASRSSRSRPAPPPSRKPAAQSHTGAIGGDYAAYLAMCERYGIVQLPQPRRHDGGRAGVRRRTAAEGAAHRLRHDLRRHRRPALRLRRGRRRARCRTIRAADAQGT